jgi:hypothetical protein
MAWELKRDETAADDIANQRIARATLRAFRALLVITPLLRHA